MKIVAVLCVLVILTGCGGMYSRTLDEIRARPAEQIEVKKEALCVYTVLHRTLVANYGDHPTNAMALRWEAVWYPNKRMGEVFGKEDASPVDVSLPEYPLHFTIRSDNAKTIIEKRNSWATGTDWKWKEIMQKILHETDYSECPAP